MCKLSGEAGYFAGGRFGFLGSMCLFSETIEGFSWKRSESIWLSVVTERLAKRNGRLYALSRFRSVLWAFLAL